MAVVMLLKSAKTEFSQIFETSAPHVLRITENVSCSCTLIQPPPRANLPFAQQTQRRLPNLSPWPVVQFLALLVLPCCLIVPQVPRNSHVSPGRGDVPRRQWATRVKQDLSVCLTSSECLLWASHCSKSWEDSNEQNRPRPCSHGVSIAVDGRQ
uniref:Uncharacterized protein n=1 Tax=Molossus molossus TaxID=27622 RepID=A0A7J8FYZ7_MOLMO|nr:hypothetical protein HJG59_008294 [Molossus molossus]